MRRLALVTSLAACAPVQASQRGPSAPQQSSKETFTEVAQIYVHNVAQDFCLGVLIAPHTVVTAAHCAAFNPPREGDRAMGTWTVVLGDRSFAARSFLLFDGRMAASSREDYFTHPEIVDVAVLFLDAEAGPIVSIARAREGLRGLIRRRIAPVASSALSTVDGGLILVRTAQQFQTSRLTGPGDSGTPFFLAGTHQVLGIETRFDEVSDTWTALDGEVQSWLSRVAR